MNSLISIQILRAVAAWLVVYHHYRSTLYEDESNVSLGMLGVSIFFLISGFIMFYSLASRTCSAKEFFVRRLIRIVPAYWFYTFLTVLLSLMYAKEFSSTFVASTGWNLNNLISSLFFIGSKVPSGVVYFPILRVGWTLSFEMFFYALLSLCILTFGRLSFWACIFALFLLPLAWDEQWVCTLLLSNKFLWLFAYGIILGYAYIKLRNTKPLLLYVAGIALIVVDIALIVLDVTPFTNPQALIWIDYLSKFLLIIGGGFEPLCAILLIGSALCFESVLSKTRVNALRWLRYLGDVSYSTYLLHTLVLGVLLRYIWRPESTSGELFLLPMTALIIFAISHLSYQYIETGPLLKTLIRKIRGWG